MLCALAALAVILLGHGAHAADLFSSPTASCTGSCSPTECAVNTEEDCSLSVPTPDFAKAMTDLSCAPPTPPFKYQ